MADLLGFVIAKIYVRPQNTDVTLTFSYIETGDCTLAFPAAISFLNQFLSIVPLLNVPSTHSKTHVAATKVGLFLAGIVQLLCVLLADKLHDAKLARMPRRPIISRTMRSELFTSPTRTSMLKIISAT